MSRERKPEAIAAGQRLRRTREALGITTTRRFAQLTAEPEANVQKWETGAALVPPRYISKIKQIYGVTQDWVYDGDMARLPHDLVLKLTDSR